MGFDSWLTCPKTVLPGIRETFGGTIDFDPCSNIVAQEYIQAKEFCVAPNSNDALLLKDDFAVKHFSALDTMYINGLDQFWRGNVFVNPPYSAGNIDKFVDKGIYEWRLKDTAKPGNEHEFVHQMIYLVNSSTDSQWYHNLMNECSCALLWRGRIKFWKIFDGKAHEKWIGEKSKTEGTNKAGNSPRYLSTFFYFGSRIDRFKDAFKDKGTFVQRI